jgi:hypothetical protein
VEAPITRIIRILHDVQSMPYSSTSPDGIAVQCICGKPEVSAEDIQCVQCHSWQHVNCYYASAKPSTSPHECLMCNLEVSITVPYKTGTSLRQPSNTAIARGSVDQIDPHITSWLKNTARNFNGRGSLVTKAETSQAHISRNKRAYNDRSLNVPETRSRDDLLTRRSISRVDHRLTLDKYDNRTEVYDVSESTHPDMRPLSTIPESWTPPGQQHNRPVPQPGASAHTNHGPRASTPQVPIHTLRSGVSAHRGNIRATFRRHGDWPDDRTTNQGRPVDVSSEARQHQHLSYNSNHPNSTNPFINTHRTGQRQNESMS